MSKSGLITKLQTIFSDVTGKSANIKATEIATGIYDEVAGSIGDIVAYGNNTPPTGTLECDGSAISRTTYASLFAIIGENFGEGDGSLTFNIPDLRGQFLRGYDNGAGTDPNAGARTAMATGGVTGDNVGSVQGDENKLHSHDIPLYGNSPAQSNRPAASGDTNYNTSRATTDSGGDESRPINASVMFIIKY